MFEDPAELARRTEFNGFHGSMGRTRIAVHGNTDLASRDPVSH
jgi:hypothetical protein